MPGLPAVPGRCNDPAGRCPPRVQLLHGLFRTSEKPISGPVANCCVPRPTTRMRPCSRPAPPATRFVPGGRADARHGADRRHSLARRRVRCSLGDGQTSVVWVDRRAPSRTARPRDAGRGVSCPRCWRDAPARPRGANDREPPSRRHPHRPCRARLIAAASDCSTESLTAAQSHRTLGWLRPGSTR